MKVKRGNAYDSTRNVLVVDDIDGVEPRGRVLLAVVTEIHSEFQSQRGSAPERWRRPCYLRTW